MNKNVMDRLAKLGGMAKKANDASNKRNKRGGDDPVKALDLWFPHKTIDLKSTPLATDFALRFLPQGEKDYDAWNNGLYSFGGEDDSRDSYNGLSVVEFQRYESYEKGKQALIAHSPATWGLSDPIMDMRREKRNAELEKFLDFMPEEEAQAAANKAVSIFNTNRYKLVNGMLWNSTCPKSGSIITWNLIQKEWQKMVFETAPSAIDPRGKAKTPINPFNLLEAIEADEALGTDVVNAGSSLYAELVGELETYKGYKYAKLDWANSAVKFGEPSTIFEDAEKLLKVSDPQEWFMTEVYPNIPELLPLVDMDKHHVDGEKLCNDFLDWHGINETGDTRKTMVGSAGGSAKADAEAEAEAKVKAEAEAKVKAEAEAKVKAEAEAKVKAEAEAKGATDATDSQADEEGEIKSVGNNTSAMSAIEKARAAIANKK